MMTDAIKVSRSDKAIKAILAATYPEWKGRRVRVVVATNYRLENYWDGGSRCYVKAYAIATGAAAEPVAATSTPWKSEAHAVIEVPQGVLLVEHQIFMGKDAGITIYVNPSNVDAAALPQAREAA